MDGGAFATRSFTGNLTIKLKAGNDTVSFDLASPIVLPKGLLVTYGGKDSGAKVTQTINATTNTLSVARNLNINYRANGSNTVTTTLDNLRVTGNVIVSHGNGDSSFTADSKALAGTFAVIGGNLSVTNRSGQATNILEDTNVDKNVKFSTGKAVTTAGSTTIANVINTTLASIGGNLTVSNKSGDSTGGGDAVGDVHVGKNVRLDLGTGAFKATLANVKGTSALLIDGNLTVNGGADGTDTIALGAPSVGLSVGKNLKINTGKSHGATIAIDDTAVNENTTIATGREADTVAIDGTAGDEGSTFSGNFTMSTGPGTDSLSINSGAAVGALTDFEGGVSVNLGADNDGLTLATSGVVNFFAPAKTPVVFDGGAGAGDTNTLAQNAANVQATHGPPTFKHFVVVV